MRAARRDILRRDGRERYRRAARGDGSFQNGNIPLVFFTVELPLEREHVLERRDRDAVQKHRLPREHVFIDLLVRRGDEPPRAVREHLHFAALRERVAELFRAPYVQIVRLLAQTVKHHRTAGVDAVFVRVERKLCEPLPNVLCLHRLFLSLFVSLRM